MDWKYPLSFGSVRRIVFIYKICVSSVNKTNHHIITEILLKVVFNAIPLTLSQKKTVTIKIPFSIYYRFFGGFFLVFNATFNNISAISWW
jgi:hypothetical protein